MNSADLHASGVQGATPGVSEDPRSARWKAPQKTRTRLKSAIVHNMGAPCAIWLIPVPGGQHAVLHSLTRLGASGLQTAALNSGCASPHQACSAGRQRGVLVRRPPAERMRP